MSSKAGRYTNAHCRTSEEADQSGASPSLDPKDKGHLSSGRDPDYTGGIPACTPSMTAPRKRSAIIAARLHFPAGALRRTSSPLRGYSAASRLLVRLAWNGISIDSYIASASASRTRAFARSPAALRCEQHQGVPFPRDGLRDAVGSRVHLVDRRKVMFFGRGPIARTGGGDSRGVAEGRHVVKRPDSSLNQFLSERTQRGGLFRFAPAKRAPRLIAPVRSRRQRDSVFAGLRQVPAALLPCLAGAIVT